jgi:hypothetical protein
MQKTNVIVRVPAKKSRVGKLGKVAFQPGLYIYTGNARSFTAVIPASKDKEDLSLSLPPAKMR